MQRSFVRAIHFANMSIVGEFVVETEAFALGRALAVEGARVELDRVVSTRDRVSDVWVWTEDLDGFADRVNERSSAVEVTVHDRVDGGGLCGIVWAGDRPDVLRGIVAADLTLVEAAGGVEKWSFSLRAHDWAELTTFREFCDRHDIDFRLDHLAQQSAPGRSTAGSLTTIQRETLVEAFRRGYYDSPRRVTLEDLAEEFGVSPRAVSQRLRRGVANLVESTLPTEV